MISNVDKLLLTDDQQTEIRRMKEAWKRYADAGDTAGMEAAHRRAEEIRASAGYSGGEDGSEYHLLKTADAPAGFAGYENLLQRYAGSGLNAIAAGYAGQLAQLDQKRQEILEREEADQSAARSAAWNRQRMAKDGLLTQGVGNSGLADVITASALNQASANAYQALLDRRSALAENDTARAEADATAKTEAASLLTELGKLLGDAYGSFYQKNAERAQDLLLQNLKTQASKEKAEQDYFYELALQKLKREWELEDQRNGL